MFVTHILSKVRAYLRYRETVRELSLLTDRELDDLGISRFQIDSVARYHVPPKFSLHCSTRRPARPQGGHSRVWGPRGSGVSVRSRLIPDPSCG